MNERDKLLPYFDMVKDDKHWKNPIDKNLLISDSVVRDNISNSIHFFTGTHATWKHLGGDLWNVKAAGYYCGPCN